MDAPEEPPDTVEFVLTTPPRDTTADFPFHAGHEFAAVSHPGRVRHHNEDHYLITRLARRFSVIATNMPEGSLPNGFQGEAYGLVVADGMGGMAAGETASLLAIKTGVELVLQSPVWATHVDSANVSRIVHHIFDQFQKVDLVVSDEARADRQLNGMGTTLTLAYLADHKLFVVHVGDSRAYLFRGGRLRQLTHDHTMAQGLADAGAIRPEEVAHHAKRHVLTNFVGGPTSGVHPEANIIDVEEGDILLVCSDGLTDMVLNHEIASILERAQSADEAAHQLLDQALVTGGRDNITVLIARIGPLNGS